MEPKDTPCLENDFYEYACECEFCYRQFHHDDQFGVECCRWILKGKEQRGKISQLVIASSEFITLIVGPKRKKLSCHKILLRYASERFFALPSKNCPSSIELPDELFEPMSAWIAWMYTGHVPPTCKLAPEALFIFGERLQSLDFRNEVMLCVFSRYARTGHREEFFEDITPAMADYVYNNVKGSKLRNYVVNWVLEVCPLTGGDRGNTGLHHMNTDKENEEMRGGRGN